MIAKKVLTIALLVFVVAAAGTLAVKSLTKNRASDVSMNAPAIDQSSLRGGDTESSDDYHVVYYFMTSQRCETCKKFEAYTKEAIETDFSGSIADKKLIWEIVNMDEPQNSHYVQDFQLFTKSVVLVNYRNGMRVGWKNLDQIWNLVGDKSAFQNYITNEMTTFIGEHG